MCGIYGIIGDSNNASEKVVEGLRRLEYRGYDSAGVAFLKNDAIKIIKRQGEISVLSAAVATADSSAEIAIGHTRWATHGAPNEINSHPHLSYNSLVAVVHNGIIENYLELKSYLTSRGVLFASETDTEVICNLLAYLMEFEGLNSFDAVKQTAQKLKGSFAFCVCIAGSNKLYAAKKDSPLVIAVGDSGNIISSDIQALGGSAKLAFLMANNEIAVLEAGGAEFFKFTGERVNKTAIEVTGQAKELPSNVRGGLMAKEIAEVPVSVQNTCSGIKTALKQLNFKMCRRIKNADIIYFVACGTAYHACLNAQGILQAQGILCAADLASEFRFNSPHIGTQSVCVFVSQSGETADTLRALEFAASRGAFCIAITNVRFSTISFKADLCFYTEAGLERAVAATKSFNSQLIALYLICSKISRLKNLPFSSSLQRNSLCLPRTAAKESLLINKAEAVARAISGCQNIFFIGKCFDYIAAREGALKVKEISYIASEAFAAGELKHGSIALISKASAAIAVITDKSLLDKMLSSISEIKAREAKVIIITCLNRTDFKGVKFDYFLKIPATAPCFSPLISVMPMQAVAYHLSMLRGLNPDKPRNLAKSVTVE